MKITKGRIDQPWREMMVGTEGAGKTTYAATCPAPLFLACEDGTGQLDVARVAVETYSDVTDAIADLTRDAQGFQTIVILAPHPKDERGRIVHSAKPAALHEIAERLSPGPRIELFARRARPGWEVWGDQAPEVRGA